MRSVQVCFPVKVWAILLVAVPVVWGVQLPLRTYTTADGLPRNAVFCIVPDGRGFLWFCTNGGLARFDGKTFDLFGVDQGLPNRVVNDFLETRNGVMLAATNQGLARLDPAAAPGSPRQFVTIPTQSGKPALRIERLFEDAAGIVWAGALGGLYRLDTARDVAHLAYLRIGNSDLLVQSLAGDGANGLWIGTNVGLCRRGIDGHIEWFSIGRSSPPAGSVNTLLLDKDARLWVGTYNGLWLLSQQVQAGRRAVFQVYGRSEGLASERIHSFFQSPTGTLWIGTAAGLAELVPAAAGTLRFRSYGSAEGLRGRVVFAIDQSKDGSLWVGVDHGLARISRNGFVRYTEADGMGEIGVTAFAQDLSGQLYAVSNELRGPKLHRIDGAKFDTIRPAYPPNLQGSGWGLEQIVLIDHTGEWWFATGEGLIRFPAVKSDELPHTRPRAVYTAKNGLPSSAILRIFEDSHNRIWVSTLSGLIWWSRATGTFHHFAQEEVPGYVSAFAEDRAGDVWIAASAEPSIGQSSRLFRFRQGQIRKITSSGVPDSWIATMFVDHAGRLWIGSSDNGLTRVDDPTAEQVRLGAGVQGLSGTGVSAIAEDRWGRIYAATPRGIDRLDPANAGMRHYSSADGLPPSPVAAMTTDREGRIWLGTALGVASFQPAVDSPPVAVHVVIKAVEVNDKPRTISEQLASGIRLRPNENHLQFHFAAPGAPENESLRYEYRLKDLSQSWSQPSLDRDVNYSNLPPGQYLLQVRSVISGEVRGPPAELNFSIEPHFWQRWWFKLLTASGIVALAFGWHRYDLQRRVEIERVRARIAADLHDDLGANLTRIVILSEVVQRHTVSANRQLSLHLAEIADRARGLADGMSDLVWSVNPLCDDISSLLNRLREFASDVLEPQGIEWSLETTEAIQVLPLSPDRRWHLFLILKEAINNAARHARCTLVVIAFDTANGCARVGITDNGCGLRQVPALDEGGNGFANMRRRAGELRGDLRIQSTPGAGVRVELIFPIQAPVRHNKVVRPA